MARQPSKTDFIVNVEGEGRFIFARRTMLDEITIQREYARHAGGVEPTVWLATLAEYLSTLSVLTVEAPESWDIEAMDPLEDETYKRIGRVFAALRERENTFRRKPDPISEGQRPVAGGDGGSVVSQDVSVAAEPSPVSGDDA